MVRRISILTIAWLCLIFGMGTISYADSERNVASMQEHIEQVMLTNPEEYQAMVERAGGKITGCRSCHDKLGKEKEK